jgi:hypothetical protein
MCIHIYIYIYIYNIIIIILGGTVRLTYSKMAKVCGTPADKVAVPFVVTALNRRQAC